MKKLLSPVEAAEILGTTPKTLAVWRCTKRHNLPYVKVGKKVLYREEDILSFIEARVQAAE